MSLTIILVHKIGTNLGRGKTTKIHKIADSSSEFGFFDNFIGWGDLVESPRGNFIQMSLEVEFRQKFTSIGKEVFSWK